jgi:hypothetical protein
MGLNRLFHMPSPGFADYRTPLRGLYHGSSATHAGGGVNGIPGWQASGRRGPITARGEPAVGGDEWQDGRVGDADLLRRAEEALTEIKFEHGLSERHGAVLAALRIRLKGSMDKSLEEMLEAADDENPSALAEKLAEAKRRSKPSLDDLLSKPKPKPEWPS